jgi:hypothetical protein
MALGVEDQIQEGQASLGDIAWLLQRIAIVLETIKIYSPKCLGLLWLVGQNGTNPDNNEGCCSESTLY